MPQPEFPELEKARRSQRHVGWLTAGLVVLPWVFAAAGFAVGHFTCSC